MSFPPEFSDTQKYANIYNLDKIGVFLEGDSSDPMFLELKGLPKILTYGKHYATISFKDMENSQYYLKERSNILFEVKDLEGTVVFSDLTTLNDLNGAAVFYIWIKKDPLRTYKDIENGMGTLTFVGELAGVPEQWKDVYNYRCTYPIEIRKDLHNNSPILFQNITNIQASSSFTNVTALDKDSLVYKRSYLTVSASNLETYGGKVDKVELSYNESSSLTTEYSILTTYNLSSSMFEITGSTADGLNPVSDEQKFQLPTNIRGTKDVEFKLKFLNSAGEYAMDLSNNKTVEITGSISNIDNTINLTSSSLNISGALNVSEINIVTGSRIISLRVDPTNNKLIITSGSTTAFTIDTDSLEASSVSSSFEYL